jgi:tetratricopeptide (TPR) repeat protein
MRLSIAALSLAIFGSALPGCATVDPSAQSTPPSSGAGNSTASSAAAPAMDYVRALMLVHRWGPITAGGFGFVDVARYTATGTEVTVTLKNGAVYHCRYADTPDPVITRKVFADPPTSVDLNCRGQKLSVWNSEQGSKTLVAAWKTMLAGPVDSPEQAATFEAAVAKYRADPAGFVLPEAAHALKVQAESAVREKRYWDAADRFSKALAISPAWAPGHFNLALIYGELELPGLAIQEMNKYLNLEPNAPDARAVQDKIYEWQDKARR